MYNVQHINIHDYAHDMRTISRSSLVQCQGYFCDVNNGL